MWFDVRIEVECVHGASGLDVPYSELWWLVLPSQKMCLCDGRETADTTKVTLNAYIQQ